MLFCSTRLECQTRRWLACLARIPLLLILLIVILIPGSHADSFDFSSTEGYDGGGEGGGTGGSSTSSSVPRLVRNATATSSRRSVNRVELNECKVLHETEVKHLRTPAQDVQYCLVIHRNTLGTDKAEGPYQLLSVESSERGTTSTGVRKPVSLRLSKWYLGTHEDRKSQEFTVELSPETRISRISVQKRTCRVRKYRWYTSNNCKGYNDREYEFDLRKFRHKYGVGRNFRVKFYEFCGEYHVYALE